MRSSCGSVKKKLRTQATVQNKRNRSGTRPIRTTSLWQESIEHARRTLMLFYTLWTRCRFEPKHSIHQDVSFPLRSLECVCVCFTFAKCAPYGCIALAKEHITQCKINSMIIRMGCSELHVIYTTSWQAFRSVISYMKWDFLSLFCFDCMAGIHSLGTAILAPY